jgi:hypothetical protein
MPEDHPVTQIPADVARDLAAALSVARQRGGDERALRDIIANRLRLRKAETRALHDRFDAAWHAGVRAALHGGTPPPLDEDPFAHHAFLQGSGGATALIDVRGGTDEATTDPGQALDAEDLAYYARLGSAHFAWRSAIVAVVVAVTAWWLCDAPGWLQYAVPAASAFAAVTLGLQAATVIEYLVMLALIALIAGGLAAAGHGEFLWPLLGGGMVGALDGTGRRETLRKCRIARAAATQGGR